MKTVKTENFTANKFDQPGERILCALIIGPDRDDHARKTLHFRTDATVLEEIKQQPLEFRLSFLKDATQLLEALAEKVLA